MKIRKMQQGGYPTNVRELLSGLESDMRGSTLPPVGREDEDILTNQRRRTQGPVGPVLPEGFSPPSFRPIRNDSQFYTPEEQRQREFMRPGGTSDQYKQAMGEMAAGFAPGVGEAQEAAYIARDLQAGDYDAAGLGALLALLPGALGKYGTDLYKAARNKFFPMPRQAAIDDMMRRNLPNMDPNPNLRARNERQAIARPIDAQATGNWADMQRKRNSLLFDDNVDPSVQQPIIDELIEDGFLKPGATVQEARDLVNREINNVEMLYGSDVGEGALGYGEMAPLDAAESRLAASRRGGMPFDEYMARGDWMTDGTIPGMPENVSGRLRSLNKQIDELAFDAVNGSQAERATANAALQALQEERAGIIRNSLKMFDEGYERAVDRLSDVYLKLEGIMNPTAAQLEEARSMVRRDMLGLGGVDRGLGLRDPGSLPGTYQRFNLNKNGGKILKYRKG